MCKVPCQSVCTENEDGPCNQRAVYSLGERGAEAGFPQEGALLKEKVGRRCHLLWWGRDALGQLRHDSLTNPHTVATGCADHWRHWGEGGREAGDD